MRLGTLAFKRVWQTMYTLGIQSIKSYGNHTNIKITTKEDLDIFEGYVLMRQKRLLSQSTNNDSEGC